MNNLNAQKGFTLLELMIAAVIGLIITVAAAQVYTMGIRNASVQKAASGVLDANVFGLQQIEKNMRMAGLGLGKTSNLDRSCSGILVSSEAGTALNCDGSSPKSIEDTDIYTLKLEGLRSGGTSLPANMRTIGDRGPSNTSNDKTPQLTIQYRAPIDMRDCEGKLALGPRVIKEGYQEGRKLEDNVGDIHVDGQVIIERYFVERNTQTNELELRCDAGRYVLEHIIQEADVPANLNADQQKAYQDAAILGEDSPVQDMGDKGALIVSGIDDFQVRLGVKGNGVMKYASIKEHQEGKASGEIVAIKMAVLAKGSSLIPKSDALANPKYQIFGTDVTMASGQPDNAVRRVYETTVMLRNSREAKQ